MATPVFIDLVTEKGHEGVPRAHSLRLDGNLLETIGNIPHCASWRPNTRQDRDCLVLHLMAIQFDDGLDDKPEVDSADQCPSCGDLGTAEGGPVEVNDQFAEQECSCSACDAGWTLRFRLSEVLNFDT